VARCQPDGTLTYTFVESVKATYPFYVIRVVGGLLYLGGMLVMAWNVWMTAISGRSVKVPVVAVTPHTPDLEEPICLHLITRAFPTRRSKPATS
jgi:cbb3-type cytochrome oxidase subunit 1